MRLFRPFLPPATGERTRPRRSLRGRHVFEQSDPELRSYGVSKNKNGGVDGNTDTGGRLCGPGKSDCLTCRHDGLTRKTIEYPILTVRKAGGQGQNTRFVRWHKLPGDSRLENRLLRPRIGLRSAGCHAQEYSANGEWKRELNRLRPSGHGGRKTDH